VTRDQQIISSETSQTHNIITFPQIKNIAEINLMKINKLFSGTMEKMDNQSSQSIVDILVRYFTDKVFMKHFRNLSIENLKAEFFILALHALLLGNFGHTLQLHSKLTFNLNGEVSSLGLWSEKFCPNIPIIFWSETVEKIPENVIHKIPLPKNTEFSDKSHFLSVKIQCVHWECMWRINERKNRQNYRNDFIPYSINWEESSTISLLNYLKTLISVFKFENIKMGTFLYNFVNILNEYDSRLIVDNDNDLEFSAASSTFFFPGYKMNVEKKMSAKPISTVLSKRNTTFLNKYHNPHFLSAGKSLKIFVDFVASIVYDFSKQTTTTTANVDADILSSTVHGTISQYIQPQNLAGTKLVVYEIIESDNLSTRDFVTIFVKRQSTAAPTAFSAIRKEKVAKGLKTIHINVVTIYIGENESLQSTKICHPPINRQSIEKTRCMGMSNPQDEQVYDFSSLITVEKKMHDTHEVKCAESLHIKPSLNLFKPDINRNRERITVAKIHKYILYSMIGEIVARVARKIIVKLGAGNLGFFANLTRDFYATKGNEKCTAGLQVSHKIDHTFQKQNFTNFVRISKENLIEILEETPCEETNWENLKILPVDDGLFIGIMENTGKNSETTQFLTFSIKNIHTIKGHKGGKNLVFLSSGTKTLETDNSDDIVFVDKSSILDGFIDTKGGTDTLILVSSHHLKHHVNITSDKNQLLTLITQNYSELTILGVENLWGAKSSVDLLDLKHCAGLKFVNLQGGISAEEKDQINVNIPEKCVGNTEITVVLEKFTDVNHISGSSRLNYRFISGPVNLRNSMKHGDLNEIQENTAFISVNFDLAELLNLLITKNEETGTVYVQMDFSLNLYEALTISNFDQSTKVTFNDGYRFEMKHDGKFHIARDCTISRKKSTFDEYLYHILSENGVRFIEACFMKNTIVHVGQKTEETLDETTILPKKYIKLQNDPYADETHFMKQDYSDSEKLPCVFTVTDFCQTTTINDGDDDHTQCKLVKLQVELNIKNVFDLRQITGKFEDENFLIYANVSTTDRTETVLRIYALKSSIQKLIPLVEIRLIDQAKGHESISIITTRYRLKFHSGQNKFSESFLIDDHASELIVIDYKNRLPIFLDLIEHGPKWKTSDIVMEKQHGDELIWETKAYEKPTSAIFLERQPRNSASMCRKDEY